MSYSNLPPAPPPPSGGGYGYGPPQRGPQPASVGNAVKLMFVQVALSLIGVVVLLLTKDDLKKDLQKDNADFTDSTLNTAITIGVVIGIVFIVLYALLALQVGKGKNWARIVTWVLAGLGILSGLAGLGQTQTTPNRILGIIGLIVSIGIVVLLAMKDSNRYFKPR